MALILALACGGPDPVGAALAPWPDDPREILASCDAQTFPELTVPCRVEAAARFAGAGDGDEADRVCATLPAGTWRDECWFRAGEELGRAGRTAPALARCARAGWFARNCLTHAGWNLPPDPALRPDTPPEVLESAASELLAQVDQALAGAGDGLEGEGRDIVLSRFGYNLYVGTGSADPPPAHIADPLGAAMRTGFGIEATRLLLLTEGVSSGTVTATATAIWRGEVAPPTGAALPPRARVGRWAPPDVPERERGLPHLPVYGGGFRLVGETPEEDAAIAALEGLFWNGAGPEAFVAWTADPRPRVAWTAERLAGTAGR